MPNAAGLAFAAVACAAGAARAQSAAPQPPRPPMTSASVSCESAGAEAPGAMSWELMARARAAARRATAPRGYLGLRLGEVSDEQWTEGGRLVRYCAYPVVVSVEPASPAERAGLEAGDTLVAYGARDLLRDGPVPLDRLLTPGETLRVRVRRGGRTLTRAVTVGRRPAPGTWATHVERYGPALAPSVPRTPVAARGLAGFAPMAPAAPLRVHFDRFTTTTGDVAWPSGEPDDRDDRGDRRVQVRVLTGGRGRLLAGRLGTPMAVADSVVERAAWLQFLPVGPGAWAQAGPAGAPFGAVYAGPSALAGMQVMALNDDLREVLADQSRVPADSAHNVPVRGVLVLKVLPGTPAAEAGLRGGDVVTAAQGRPVETPAALQRVLAGRALAGRGPTPAGEAAERRAVELRVARAGTVRELTLRW